MNARITTRRGFALLTVLWVLVAATVLAVQVELTARNAIGTSLNRMGALRASWVAEGCIAAFRATIDRQLSAAKDPVREWSAVAGVLAAETSAGCSLSVRAAGTALDVNVATPDQLRRLFVILGRSTEAADSLADAIGDWIDADDLVRPTGAERDWYVAA